MADVKYLDTTGLAYFWEKIKAQLNQKQNTITNSNKLSASLISGLATVATSGSYKDLTNKPGGADIYYDVSDESLGSIKSMIDSLIANKQNLLDDGTENIHVKQITLGSGSATNITTGFTEQAASEILNTTLTTASSVISYVTGKNYATQSDVENGLKGKQDKITSSTDLTLNTLTANRLVLSNSAAVTGINSVFTDTVSSGTLPTAAAVVSYVLGKDYATETYVDEAIADLGDVLEYKGTVTNYSDLPTTDRSKGDVYNVTNAYGDYPAGTNFAWNGTAWDALGGAIDLSGYQLAEDLIAITTGEIDTILAS